MGQNRSGCLESHAYVKHPSAIRYYFRSINGKHTLNLRRNQTVLYIQVHTQITHQLAGYLPTWSICQLHQEWVERLCGRNTRPIFVRNLPL